MKPTLITIILMLTLSSQAQFINFGWSRQCVKAQNRDKELIYSAPDYLEYKTQAGYIAYEFNNRHCTAASVCMDSTAATRFIAERLAKNWRLASPGIYYYYPDNVDTIRVEADWFGGNAILKYTLKN